MKTHEFAAISIVLLLVVWVGFAVISPSYAARNKIGLPGIGGDVGSNLAGYNAPAAGGSGAGTTGSGTNSAPSGSGSGVANSGAPGGPGQTVTIAVKGAGNVYDPSVIRVHAGTHVRMDFDPNTLRGCESIVNIWGLNQQISLSASNHVLEFTADTPGTYRMSCSMGMINGQFIVEAADGSAPAQTAQSNSGSNIAPSGPVGGCGGAGGVGGCGGAVKTAGSAPSGGCGCGG